MGSSSWFDFFKALFLETLHQNQLFEGTPLGLQSLSKILIHLCAFPLPQCWFGHYSGLSTSKYAWLNIGEGEGTLQWEQLFQLFVTSIVALSILSQIYAYHNPLTPNITNINVLLTMPIHSRRQMDIELIKWMLWSFIKPSPLISKEMYGDRSEEFVCGYWGLKG